MAIGELTDGLDICLDAVPKKYEGLDGTELAISESQERMAVVVAAKDVEKFMAYATEENLEATVSCYRYGHESPGYEMAKQGCRRLISPVPEYKRCHAAPSGCRTKIRKRKISLRHLS